MFTKKDENINRNGRPKGRQNKSTEELRNIIQTFLENNIKKLQTTFDSLEAKEQIQAINKLLAFVVPKLSNINGNLDIEAKNTFTPIKGITFDEEYSPDLSKLSNDELGRLADYTKMINDGDYFSLSKDQLIDYSMIKDKIKFTKGGNHISVIEVLETGERKTLSLKE